MAATATEASAEASAGAGELKSIGYEVFVAAVSILSIVNLVLITVVAGQSLQYVLYAMNAILSVILFGDFCYRLATAPSRWGYLGAGFGWADLLAGLPIPQVKVLRVFRVLRVGRLLRTYGLRPALRALVHDRAGSSLFTLLLLALLMLEFGSLAMLRVEADVPGSTITTASDALWYNVVTMATVGYGDTYPVTNAGRLLGSLVIIVGVGIFGTLTGFLANAFLGSRGGGDDAEEALEAAVDEGAAREPDPPGQPGGPDAAVSTGHTDDAHDLLARLQQQLAEQQALLAELDRRLPRP